MIQIIQFICSLIVELFSVIGDALRGRNANSAAFGSTRLIGSRFGRGFVISRNRKTSRKLAYSNMALVGVTGTGKSSMFIIPTIFSLKNCSMLIHDPSGELYNITAPYLSHHFTVQTLNFADDTKSDRYNLVSNIKTANDAGKFAHLIVSTSLDKGGGDPFWNLASKQILKIMTMLVLHQPPEDRNISSIIRLVNLFASDSEKVDQMIIRTRDHKLIEDYKAAISASEKVLQSVISSLRAALECYDTPSIAAVTSAHTISFERMRATPHVVFLHTSIADQSYLATLTSVVFEQFYNYVLQRLPQKNELSLFCILDEMSSLKVPLLPLALANCRKFLCGNLVSIQGKSRLRGFYKDDADSILSNCLTKVYLPGISAIDELREIEALSGKCTYVDKNKHEKTKSLVTVEEIRQLPQNRALILSQNHSIILSKTAAYFSSLVYRHYAKTAPKPAANPVSDNPE